MPRLITYETFQPDTSKKKTAHLAMVEALREFLELREMVESPTAEMVTLFIRQPHPLNHVRIQVHKGILLKRSPRIALHCKRIHDDTVDLTAEQPSVIKDYVAILHTGHVLGLKSPPDGTSSMSDVAKSRYHRLTALYLFCIQSEDLVSSKIVFCAVLQFFHHKWSDGARYIPGVDVINSIYRFCLPADPLRRFLTEYYADFANGDWILREEHYNPEFMKHVLIGALARRGLPKCLSRTLNPRGFIDLKEPESTTTKPTELGRKGLKRRRASM